MQGYGQGRLAAVALGQPIGAALLVVAFALQAGQGLAAGRQTLAGHLQPLAQGSQAGLGLPQGTGGGGIALLQMAMQLLKGLQLGGQLAALELDLALRLQGGQLPLELLQPGEEGGTLGCQGLEIG